MRILVLSPLVPATGGSGGQTRELHLLRRQAELGHEVVVCCPVPAAQRPALEAARAAGLDVRPSHRPTSRVRETLAALATRRSLAAELARQPLSPWQLEVLWQGMAPQVTAALAEREPDVALVIWDLAAAWRAHLPADLPAVVSLHDASWEYATTRARAVRSDVGDGRVVKRCVEAAAWRLEAARLRRFDARWLPRYNTVVCVSDDEAARVRALAPAVTPVVVPNGVDLTAFAPAPEAPGPPAVLFTGTMNYPPNSEGALWLGSRVWPRVRRARPNARLLVVGRDPTAAVRGLHGRDGIEILGGVPDMARWFAAAHVVAVPVRSGGGTRLKVLEAAASGRPIVSTRLGVEGLELRAGDEVLVADEPDGFAAALADLLGDAPRRAALGEAARAVAAERYGWPALGDRLADVLERVAATGRRKAETPIAEQGSAGARSPAR